MPEQGTEGPRAIAKIAPVSTPGTAELLMLAVFVVAVSGLYFAREIMVPITLAVLLSFVLAPLVAILRRIHMPRVPAVILAVIVAVGVILALAGLIGMQLATLASDLPRYQYTIERKATVLQQLTVGRLSDLSARLEKQATLPPAPKPTSQQAGTAPPPKPVLVEVQAAPPSPVQIARDMLGPIVGPLETVAIVFVVAVFFLMQQDDLRDRLIRLFGSSDLHRTTVALDDAARRLSRYFLMQLGVNAAFGCVIGGGLLLIGVPSPVLWGIMGALLRFVPYIGSWLAALLPAALACAVDPGWSMVIWTVALYAVVELTVGQVVEPLLYGHSTGLSPTSVVVAAIFWSWLWGPIGLILSTPLTLCLVVLGRHVPRLEFLDVLLGDRPALTPVESFYQRILAGDADQTLAQAEQMLAERPLSSYYDEVALKGLGLAAVDVDRGVLQPGRIEEVLKTVLEVVGDLDEHEDTVPPNKDVAEGPVSLPDRETSVPQEPPAGPDLHPDEADEAARFLPVLCVAGRGPFDEAAAAMLAQLLGKHGIPARTLPYFAVSRGQIAKLEAGDAGMICLCGIAMSGDADRLRYLLRRIRHQAPGAAILVGLWPGEPPGDDRLRLASGADHVAATLTDAVNACLTNTRTKGRARMPELLPA